MRCNIRNSAVARAAVTEKEAFLLSLGPIALVGPNCDRLGRQILGVLEKHLAVAREGGVVVVAVYPAHAFREGAAHAQPHDHFHAFGAAALDELAVTELCK